MGKKDLIKKRKEEERQKWGEIMRVVERREERLEEKHRMDSK